MKSPQISRKRFLGLLSLGTLVSLVLPLAGEGHIVREDPWHPVPSGYLRSLFFIKLKPIDWDAVAGEYNRVEDPASLLNSLWDGLAPASTLDGTDHNARIRAAIQARDPDALASTSTHAISQLTRFHLHLAAARLDDPGTATEHVREASRIYRAFDRFIKHADPPAARDVGIAWLELTSSLGSSGVETLGAKLANTARFEAARLRVENYLRANYEDANRPAGTIDPLPATVTDVKPVPPWLPPGSDLNDQDPLPRLVLNFEEICIDERDLFLVAYGDMLFDSPEIFGDPARNLGVTCSTCHNRSDINRRFFIPGISPHPGSVDVDGHFFNPRFNDHRSDALDIPSLRGIRFTAPYGRDGRFASLRDFVRNVIVSEFAGDEPTPMMLDALVAYMLEFDWLPTPYLNADGTLNEHAPPAARRGEEIFNRPFDGMGARACSTCHVPADNFMDRRRHDIGSAMATVAGARGSFFDTPTLINVKYTAPYLHDGSLETLGAVVVWFNEHFELGLGDTERDDLTAYIEAVGTGMDPYEVFDDENTPFRLFWGELTTFTSTLDTLIPARDAHHVRILIDTVVNDMRADASALVDLSMAPYVHEVADALDQIGDAAAADDWKRATKLWNSYKKLETKYDPMLR